MLRALWIPALVLTTYTSVCLAQPLPAIEPNLDPATFDLSGTWVMHDPGGATAESSSFCLNFNRYKFGRATLELQRTGTELGYDEEEFAPFLRVFYRGTYTHRNAYSVRKRTGVVEQRLVCDFEDVVYRVEGSLTRLEDSTEPGQLENPRYRLNLVATVDSAPEANAQSEYTFVGDNIVGEKSRLFVDDTGNQISVSMRPTGEALNSGTFPDGCDGQYTEADSRVQCYGYSGGTFRFQRGEPDLSFVPKGPLSGRLRAIDGQKPALANATVRLLKLRAPARPRANAELEEDYQAYLDAHVTDAASVQVTTSDAQGNFAFEGVDLLERKSGENRTERVLYAVAVSGATRAEGESQVLYQPKITPNIKVPEIELEVELAPFDALSQKANWVRRLSELGPLQYGPVEAQVQMYLSTLISGGAPSPAQIEGVRRAIFAERAVYEGSAYAKTFLSDVFTTFADLLAPIVEEIMSRRHAKLKGAQDKLTNLRDARFAAVQNAFSSFERADLSSVNASIRKLSKKNVSLQQQEALKYLKFFLKYAIFDRWSAAADSEADRAIIRRIQTGVDILLDVIVIKQAGGAVGNLIKLTADLLSDQFFDNATEAFSYAGRTKWILQNSNTLMQSWSADDWPTYVGDITESAAQVRILIDETTAAQQRLAYAKAISSSLGTAKDVFALVPVSPHTRAAKTFSEYGQHLTNLVSLGETMRMTFSYLPDQTADAAFAAYGMRPPSAIEFGVAPIDGDATLLLEFTSQAESFSTGMLGEVNSALEQDDLVTLIELFSTDDASGFGDSFEQVATTAEMAAAVVRAMADGTGPERGQLIERVARQASQLRVDAQVLQSCIIGLTLEVLGGQWEATTPAYLRQRAACARATDALERRLGALGETLSIPRARLSAGQMFPAVAVETLRVRSESTGEGEVATAKESFTLEATLRNLGSAGLSVSAEVSAQDPSAAFEVVGGRKSAALGAVNGDGSRTTLRWTINHLPETLGTQSATFSLVLLEEDGEEPTTFVDASRSVWLGASLESVDSDLDGMVDEEERIAGLSVGQDDADADLDGDGVSNAEEFARGLNPKLADTDTDGLDDGEEITLGEDGWLTDPLLTDTDGDGSDDGEDGAPGDASSTVASASPFEEPSVSVSQTRVRLDRETPITEVVVQNGGAGTLRYAAISSDPELVRVSPSWPRSLQEGEPLSLLLHPNAPVGSEETVRVFVIDLTGQVHDHAVIDVVAGEAGAVGPDGGFNEDGGVSSDAGSDGSTPGAGSSDNGGCGCRTVRPKGSTHWLWLAVLGLLARQRKRLHHQPSMHKAKLGDPAKHNARDSRLVA